ncbi:MAG: hypothetical protein LBF50_08720 [Azoarcus sp.]|jgi:hypothetical protein|nr:hypothetical protein [Azoarcus sp.]
MDKKAILPDASNEDRHLRLNLPLARMNFRKMPRVRLLRIASSITAACRPLPRKPYVSTRSEIAGDENGGALAPDETNWIATSLRSSQ